MQIRGSGVSNIRATINFWRRRSRSSEMFDCGALLGERVGYSCVRERILFVTSDGRGWSCWEIVSCIRHVRGKLVTVCCCHLVGFLNAKLTRGATWKLFWLREGYFVCKEYVSIVPSQHTLSYGEILLLQYCLCLVSELVLLFLHAAPFRGGIYGITVHCAL